MVSDANLRGWVCRTIEGQFVSLGEYDVRGHGGVVFDRFHLWGLACGAGVGVLALEDDRQAELGTSWSGGPRPTRRRFDELGDV